jgi:hypothetical protein
MTFLSWLVDDNCFHIESDYNALSHDKARKCIAVAERRNDFEALSVIWQ